MKIKLLVLVLFISAFSWGQIFEGFEGATPPAVGWTYNSVVHGTNNPLAGARCATFDGDGDSIITPLIANPNQLSFWWRRSGTSPGTPSFTVQYGSSVTGPWTNITTGSTNPITNFTTTYQEFTAYLTTLSNIYIRVLHNRTSGTNQVYIDDFSVSTIVAVPTINVNPVSLTGFNYFVGSGPSPQQTFTVDGTNLTSNVVLTPPTGYSISTTSGSGYASSLTLPFGSGTLASTTIYVILNSGLSVNSYSGVLTATSTGAGTKNVSFAGSVSGSSQSDLIAVPSSESATVSTTINNNPPLTSTTGVRVWQFKVRDGGASLNDLDGVPTILDAITIAQASGNAVGTWTDAINTIALFDGATFIATGTVTANQIQFTGLNVTVNDNSEKTLSLRLSLKCPLGVGAKVGEDFGFSISNANATFLPTGSGKAAFAAINNVNGSNVITAIPTQLQFTVQPQITGINGAMGNAVKVTALDACGNIDYLFNGNVALTSSGTMVGSPINNTAVNGVATFSSITHSASGTGLILTAASTGLTSGTSTTFDILNITTLKPGDLAILAFNTDVDGAGTDEVTFVTFVNILPSTTIDITDNAYQKCGSANGWGISEGWIRLVRTNATLLRGTIVTVRVSGGNPSIFSPDPSNWTCSRPQPSLQGSFNLNGGGEQIFFMTGGNVGGLNATTAASDAGTYNGYFLYGFNTKGNTWTPVCGNAASGGTQNSAKPINFDCFLTWPTVQADLNKYTGLLTSASQRDWIARIGDPNNWTGYANNTLYNAGPDFNGGSISILTAGYSNGVWIGDKSTNWFECGNWQSFRVPDETVNVIIDAASSQKAVVDFTSPFSDFYLDIAKCNNLSISDKALDLIGNTNNFLEVHGNVNISSTGILNMDDGNNLTTDGSIDLYGNWTNTTGNNSFKEGNSTITFKGSSSQIINNVSPVGTEVFYNVVLNNNFDTAISNDLIAQGNLTIGSTKNVSIDSNGYIRVNKTLQHNGNITIENNGQLIQVDETDTNTGTYSGTAFQVKRIASVRNFDYVYWSSPIDNFAVNLLPTNNRYEWNTINNNSNGTQGNWVAPVAAIMPQGKGYIARASNGSATNVPLNITFQGGKPFNGALTTPIQRGSYTGIDFDFEPSNPNNVLTTKFDDNWNLIGNPYPSAIDALAFLNANSNIQGFVNIWTHQTSPVSTIDPFYQNFAYNYTTNDYISHNGTGTVSGPSGFNGKIASGQGFFVLMNDGIATSSTVSFTNAMRRDNTTNLPYANSQFYRSSIVKSAVEQTDEKNRIWLDIVSADATNVSRTLVGYVTNATNQNDRLYDAVTQYSNQLKVYTFLDNTDNQEYLIQGRALPFVISDTVKLGVSIPANGNYTFAIGAVDGLFEDNQDIFIQDNLLNTSHNIKESPYNFSSEAGNFTERFLLKYTNATLSNQDNVFNNSSVLVLTNENKIQIKSSIEDISSVEVYDVLGRLIIAKNAIDQKYVNIDGLLISNQALIVKTKLASGKVVVKKIVL